MCLPVCNLSMMDSSSEVTNCAYCFLRNSHERFRSGNREQLGAFECIQNYSARIAHTASRKASCPGFSSSGMR